MLDCKLSRELGTAPGTLTFSEILTIKERLVEYLTGIVDAYLSEEKP